MTSNLMPLQKLHLWLQLRCRAAMSCRSGYTGARAPSWGTALALAGLQSYASNCTVRLVH